MRRALVLAVLVLPACGAWPDLGLDAEVTGEGRLLPFDRVAAPGALRGAAAEAAAETDAALLARSEALRVRATAAEIDAEDRRALDTLRARSGTGG